jgi:short-subunit dehydrogenase
MAQRICVTGASGQAGRAVVTDLRAHGYDVARPRTAMIVCTYPRNPGVKYTR